MKPLRMLAVACVLLAVIGPEMARADSLAAELSYPTAGATITDLTQPFQWTPVASAQSYLLVIGSSAGQADVWISGDVSGTSVLVTRNLLRGPQLYARLWTSAHGILRHSSDVPFTVMKAAERPKVVGGPPFSPISRSATSTPILIPTPTPTPIPTPTPAPISTSIPPTPSTATMIYPTPRDPDVNFEQPFTWTTVAGAQSYELLVGTSPGLGDVFDSVETLRTSVLIRALPAGFYYGRIATNVGGLWAFNDFLFGSSGFPTATIRSPANGSFLGSGQTVFSWDGVTNADAYRVAVGTAYGGSNVADSGVITGTSFEVSSLPPDGALYARLFTSKWNAWRFTDAVFFTNSHHPTLVTPLDGASSVDTGIPFEWQSSGPPSSYRLEIGTSLGNNGLYDSGEIWVSKRFVGRLPAGQTLYGRVSERVGQVWSPVDFRFTVGANGSTTPYVVPAALWATDFVRGMANGSNAPFPNTPLANLLAAEGWTTAFCGDYATVLLAILQQMNVTQPARYMYVSLKPNSYDGHTLVEFQEPGGTWMILDPTFDLTARRSADGRWATASDISNATRTMKFSDISYDFLGARGSSVATNYYIDYPLLYLDVCGQGGCPPDGAPSSLPYMDSVSLPVNSGGVYAIQGAPGAFIRALVDGAQVQFYCDPPDGLTYIFGAQSIEPLPNFSIKVFRPHRFVF